MKPEPTKLSLWAIFGIGLCVGALLALLSIQGLILFAQ